MGKKMSYTVLFFLAQTAFAERDAGNKNAKDTVILYQVGQNGNYCVSITPDASGCVSGTDENGNRYNTLDITQGKQVIFRNVSDAPHDMVITGANKENLPAQAPQGADAQKQMGQEDMNKEKMTCSFHGDQLAVGYRVPKRGAVGEMGEGHKESPDAVRNQDPNAMIAQADDGGSKKITRTPLADVSNEVLRKGRPEDVERLVAARPALIEKLQEVRPLLAQDIAKSGLVNLKGLSKTNSALGAFPGDGGAPAAGGAAVASVKPSGTKGVGFGSASGGSAGDGGSGGGTGFGSGVKVRDLAAIGDDLDARLAEEDHNSESEEEETEGLEGADARTASLGLGTPDRTKMKVVGGMPMRSTSRGAWFSSSLTPWLIGGLAVMISVAMRFVIFGTRSRKKEKSKVA